MNEFQENILDHYKNPRNFGKPEWAIDNFSEEKNLSCGDEVKIFVSQDTNSIKKLAFEGEGCSICIASASIICEEFPNTSLKEVKEMTDERFIDKYIGIPLTTSRKKCALLALWALKKAIY